MSACLTPEQVRQLLGEQLPAEDHSRVEAHVEQCPMCQRALERLTDRLDVRRNTPVDGGTYAARFQARRWHAKGGLGEVYVAWDRELDREVALKEMQARPSHQPHHRDRFVREAKITSRLEHPGIVPVYGLGEYPDGRPYYAMRFIQGETLQETVDRLHQTTDPSKYNLAFRKLLGQFVTICETVAYAHSQGVLHRDLKPENILLGKYGEALIADWGLAKQKTKEPRSQGAKESDEDAASLVDAPEQTQEGQVLGTPAYMSPEQAGGQWKIVGPASDIYSLGATLYTVLTGRPPFAGGTALDDVRQGRFPPPRQVKPGVSLALEAICLKAMALQPQERYQSARALADDIEHWLADEPVSAYPELWWERSWRWLSRHRTLALAAFTALIVALASLMVATGFLTAANERERQARTEEKAAWEKAKQQEQEKRRSVYRLLIPLAQKGWEERRVDQVRELLQEQQPSPGEDDYRGFEWHYLWRLCHLELLTLHGHTETVQSVAYSPDGRRLASASADQTVRIWDAETGKEIHCLRGHTAAVFSVAYSPDGRYLASASADCTVKLWEAETGKKIRTLDGHTAAVTRVVFRPDGRQLASAGKEGIIKVWEVATGQDILSLGGHQGEVWTVAYSPDGRCLASTSLSSANAERAVTIWDAETGQKLLHFLAGADIFQVAYSPDGHHLVAGCREGILKGWDLKIDDAMTGAKLAFELRGPEDWINSVVYSPDGRQVASAARNGDVTLRKASGMGEIFFFLRGHRGEVNSLAYSPDGRYLASAGADKTVKVWDARSPNSFILPGRARGISRLAYSPDSRRLAATNVDGIVKVWDTTTGQVLLRLRGHTNFIAGVAFSPDGRRLASASVDKTVKVWDAATGDALLTLRHKDEVQGVAFSPDGRRLASAGRDQKVRIWDAMTGQELSTLEGHQGEISSVAYNPDGRFLASASIDETVKVWDAATGQLLCTLHGHRGGVHGVTFSSDGRLASTGKDKTLKIWDAATGKLLHTLDGRTDAARQVSFSPDGRRLASAGTQRIWETEKGQELMWITTNNGATGVAFSPDGHQLATASHDGWVQIWETTTPSPALRRQRQQYELVNALYSFLGL